MLNTPPVAFTFACKRLANKSIEHAASLAQAIDCIMNLTDRYNNDAAQVSNWAIKCLGLSCGNGRCNDELVAIDTPHVHLLLTCSLRRLPPACLATLISKSCGWAFQTRRASCERRWETTSFFLFWVALCSTIWTRTAHCPTIRALPFDFTNLRQASENAGSPFAILTCAHPMSTSSRRYQQHRRPSPTSPGTMQVARKTPSTTTLVSHFYRIWWNEPTLSFAKAGTLASLASTVKCFPSLRFATTFLPGASAAPCPFFSCSPGSISSPC